MLTAIAGTRGSIRRSSIPIIGICLEQSATQLANDAFLRHDG